MRLRELLTEASIWKVDFVVFTSEQDKKDREWRYENAEKFIVNDDGTLPFPKEYEDIVLDGNLTLNTGKLLSLKSCPKIVNGSVELYSPNLKSLEGFPEQAGYVLMQDNLGLTSLEHAPQRVVKAGKNLSPSFNFSGCNNIHTLEGIGRKFLREIGELINLPYMVQHNILGLVLIKNLKKARCHPDTNTVSPRLFDALKVLANFVGGQEDVLDAKEALMEAGLKEYAKL